MEMGNKQMLLQQMIDARYYSDWASMPSPLATVLHDSGDESSSPPPPKTLQEQVEVLFYYCKEHLNIELNRQKWSLEELDEELLKDRKMLEDHDKKLNHLIWLAMEQKGLIKKLKTTKFDQAAANRLRMAMQDITNDMEGVESDNDDDDD
jgi:hypothetical protein